MSDSDLEALVRPAIEELRERLGGSYATALAGIAGLTVGEGYIRSCLESPSDTAMRTCALMIEPGLINDKFFRSWLLKNLRGKIKDASIGRIPVRGNFSILCGDPYALCQSLFGLEVTGLLGAGEIYNRHWTDREVEQVAMFRAPMTSHSNIRRVKVSHSEKAKYWYEHITTCTVLNAWDTIMLALNGADEKSTSLPMGTRVENLVNSQM